MTLDQAARVSRHSARDLRLAIESGALPATQRAGRWFVERDQLERHAAPAPGNVRAHLAEVPGSDPSSDGAAGAGVEGLLARLETAAVEVATLRERLAARRSAESERIQELERELSSVRGRLERAGVRIAELEGEGEGQGSSGSATAGTGSPHGRRQPVMREALAPLFEGAGAPADR